MNNSKLIDIITYELQNKDLEWKFHASVTDKEEINFSLYLKSEACNEKMEIRGFLFYEEEDFEINRFQISYQSEDELSEIKLFLNISSDEIDDYNELVMILTEIIFNTREYKYFRSDYKRVIKEKIFSYLCELTEMSELIWREEIIGDYELYGKIYKYLAEYGDDEYMITLNELDDVTHILDQDCNENSYEEECEAEYDEEYEDDYEEEYDYEDIMMFREIDRLNYSYPDVLVQIKINDHISVRYENEIDYKLVSTIQTGINEPKTITVHDFLIRVTYYPCLNKNHTINMVKAIVPMYQNDNLKLEIIDTMYCTDCNKYFILESDYDKLKKKGEICCNIIEDNDNQESKDGNFSNWNDQSILSRFKYNVNKNSNLSDIERKKILEFIIENKIATPDYIINFLSLQISNRNRRQNRSIFLAAISKWERDIQFVKSFKKTDRYVIAYHKDQE